MATEPNKPEIHSQPHASMPENIRALIDSAGKSSSIPHYYFNGMIIAQGTADVTVILQLNNQPVATLNCSFTIAKTLAQGLSNGIKTLETLAGREIMTVDYITSSFAKLKGEDGKPNP